MTSNKITLKQFLDKFPVAALPVTLREDDHRDFSKDNDPLSEIMIVQFINQYEPDEPDEFTEYVPCFRLTGIKDVSVIVYWKAGLMSYDYVLATYSNDGKMLDKRSIAGMRVSGENIKRTIATIDDTYTIFVAEGIEAVGSSYDADSSKISRYHIEENGMIEQEY